MSRLPLLFLLLFCASCAGEQRTVALNWYARIDHAPGCGEQQVALLAGDDRLLCPLDSAIYNADSLVAISGGRCYYLDLQNITDYKTEADLRPIDCADFLYFVERDVSAYPESILPVVKDDLIEL